MTREEEAAATDVVPQILKPTNRELRGLFDRVNLVLTRSETFFGKSIQVTFTDGTNNSFNHNTTDLEILHSLGAIPSDYVVGSINANAAIRLGQKRWTENYMYLRSSAACISRIYLVT